MDNKYYYEFERVNDYCYPNSTVLRNKFNIQDSAELTALETEIMSVSMAQAIEAPNKGKFDLKHLCAIHKFIFLRFMIGLVSFVQSVLQKKTNFVNINAWNNIQIVCLNP